MIVILCFTCQSQSSIAEINSQTNTVIFKSVPGKKLTSTETESCRLQTNFTAVYTVTIGNNIFRSQFVKYNAFQESTIELLPVNGSSTEGAIKFSIASYEISFLENSLTQEASVGQLLQTYYDYNQCIYNEQIDYETFSYITPIVQTNPKCKIIPTGDVMYSIHLQQQVILKNKITLALYNFSNLEFQSINCTIGTDEEKKQCKDLTQVVAGRNFINLNLKIEIPKTITTQNIFTDDYGVKQNVTVIYNFNMTFNISVTQRLSGEKCTNDDYVSFQNSTIFVYQSPENNCSIVDGDNYSYWVTASELSDNSGKTFQLQFYSNKAYDINQWITCSTWEISGFESLTECSQQLQQVQDYPANLSTQISYIVHANDKFKGAIRFNPKLIPSGEAALTVMQRQLCIKIDKEIKSSRDFVDITVKLSTNLDRFQKEQIDYQILNNFLYPAPDNTYCFSVPSTDQLLLSVLAYDSSFGTVSLLGSMLIVSSINSLMPYEDFWEGWAFLFGFLLLCLGWIIIQSYLRRRTSKLMK